MVEILGMLSIKSLVIPTSTLQCRDPMLAATDFSNDGLVLNVRLTRTILYSDPLIGHMNV